MAVMNVYIQYISFCTGEKGREGKKHDEPRVERLPCILQSTFSHSSVKTVQKGYFPADDVFTLQDIHLSPLNPAPVFSAVWRSLKCGTQSKVLAFHLFTWSTYTCIYYIRGFQLKCVVLYHSICTDTCAGIYMLICFWIHMCNRTI